MSCPKGQTWEERGKQKTEQGDEPGHRKKHRESDQMDRSDTLHDNDVISGMGVPFLRNAFFELIFDRMPTCGIAFPLEGAPSDDVNGQRGAPRA